MRDVKRLTELPDDMAHLKNLYENEILRKIGETDFEQDKLHKLIEQYTNLRIKAAMLNPEFATKVKKGEMDTTT